MKTDDLIQAVRSARKILLDAGIDAAVEIHFVEQGAVINICTRDSVAIEDGLYADYPADKPAEASSSEVIVDEDTEKAVTADPVPKIEASIENPPVETTVSPLPDASAASSAGAPVAEVVPDATPIVGDCSVAPTEPASFDSGAALTAAQEKLASAQAVLKGDQAFGGSADVLAADQARVDAAQAALDALTPIATASDPSSALADSSAVSSSAIAPVSGDSSAPAST
jgi:hypothetical protein